jgi:flagellar biosynthetic protein FliR
MVLLNTLKGIVESLGFGPDINAFLVLFGLALARIAMAVSLSPLLGGQSVAGTIRMAFAIMLTLLLLPGLKSGAPINGLDFLLFFVLLLKELSIGITIGLLSQLIFFAVQTAGALIDTARGMDQPGLTTPQLQSNVSALGQLKFQMALVLFLAVNGHLIYIRGLALSFERIPLRGFARFDSGTAVQRVAALGGQVFSAALQLAAPVIVALFLVDISFAALARTAPRINVYAESQPVKAFVGVAVLLFSIGLIATRFQDVISRFLWDVYQLVGTLA